MPSATTVIKGVRGDFGWFFGLLTALMSTLAIVALARHAFATWSLSAPMMLIMDAYNAVMELLFGRVQPYLQAALSWLGSFIGWRPTLYPHWRDVLVIVTLWSAGISRGLRSQGEPWMLIASLGFLGAFVAALTVGVFPLQSDDLTTQILMTTIPAAIMGLLLGGEGLFRNTWWRLCLKWLALLGLVVAVGYVTRFLVKTFPGEPAAPLGVLLLLLVYLAQGLMWEALQPIRNTHPRQRAYWRTVGLTVLGGICGAFLFFAIDAGLRLLMG